MHYTAFVITNINVREAPQPDRTPPLQILQDAAREAVEIAMNTLGLNSEDHRPESLDIGSYQAYGLIQNHDRHDRAKPADTCSWPFWSQRRGRINQPEDTLNRVLVHHWNNSSNLVKMALQPPQGVKLSDWTPIVPELTLFHDRDALAMPVQYLDVFGEDQDAVNRPNIAAQHIGTDDYARAHYLARQPLENLNRAQLIVDYVNAVAQYRDKVAIQLDWNL